MRRRLILVIAADLAWSGDGVVVGPETALVCRTAYAVWEEDRSARVIVAAGDAPAYKNTWMASVMFDHLRKLGVLQPLLLTLRAKDFRTIGEIECFWAHIEKHWSCDGYPEYDIHVVNRFWHAFRTERLVWAAMPDKLRDKVTVTMRKAPSNHLYKELWHEIRAYVRNAPNMLRGQLRMFFP